MKLNHSVAKPDQRHDRGVAALPAGGRAGVQVGGVDHPGDERPHLLGVPVPYAPQAWCAQIGPVTSTAKVQTGKRERVDPVGDPVQRRQRRAAGRGSRGRRAVPRARRRVLDQVQRRGDAAEGERAGGDDRGDARGSPASTSAAPGTAGRPGRRAHSTATISSDDHEGGDERAHPAQAVALAAAAGTPALTHERAGERELVHVAPRHPVRVRGQAAGDQRRRSAAAQPTTVSSERRAGRTSRPGARGRRVRRRRARRPSPEPRRPADRSAATAHGLGDARARRDRHVRSAAPLDQVGQQRQDVDDRGERDRLVAEGARSRAVLTRCSLLRARRSVGCGPGGELHHRRELGGRGRRRRCGPVPATSTTVRPSVAPARPGPRPAGAG